MKNKLIALAFLLSLTQPVFAAEPFSTNDFVVNPNETFCERHPRICRIIDKAERVCQRTIYIGQMTMYITITLVTLGLL